MFPPNDQIWRDAEAAMFEQLEDAPAYRTTRRFTPQPEGAFVAITMTEYEQYQDETNRDHRREQYKSQARMELHSLKHELR